MLPALPAADPRRDSHLSHAQTCRSPTGQDLRRDVQCAAIKGRLVHLRVGCRFWYSCACMNARRGEACHGGWSEVYGILKLGFSEGRGENGLQALREEWIVSPTRSRKQFPPTLAKEAAAARAPAGPGGERSR